jgi:bacterioferritin
MTKDDFLNELNIDLALEYAAAIQYIQHSSSVRGPGYQAFIEELLTHADEEIKHAKLLSDRIDYLGGIPTLNVQKRKSSEDTIEMLQQDLEGEKLAIIRYRERITQAKELNDFGTAKILINILIDEEEHENDLKTILNVK